jgi:FKBP-type peptidyl-prolyl cis-trans isomerase
MRSVRVAMVMALIGLMGVPAFAEDTAALKTQKEQEAYAVGVDLARNLRRQGIDLQAEALAKGMRDELSGTPLMLPETELRSALTSFQTGLKQKRARTLMVVAEENRKAGETFLSANKSKEGVVTLPSGLQYKVLKTGEGRTPVEADIVEVNYRGTLLDGTEFDSSFSRGQPASFKVGAVIAGWKEALRLMPAGSKWQLFIPAHLAYAEKGSGRYIGPNATLVFEVELLAIH